MGKVKDLLSNETVQRGLNNSVQIIKKGCMIVAPILVTSLFNEMTKQTVDKIRYIGNVDYDDAVRAILDSDMYSSTKQEAVSLLKKDANSNYYKSVIYTVESSMYSSDKIKMIQNMNCNEE